MKSFFKMDLKSRQYKTDKKIYLLLLILSILIIGASLFIYDGSRWFTIVAGFGCSGIASVIVAWLLDIATCVHKEEANNELLNHLFGKYDLTVQNELNCILESCAKRDSKINIEKHYSIQEVADLLNKSEENLPTWEKSYHNFGVAFTSIDASLLLSNDPIPQRNEIYTIVKNAQDNHNAYEYMTSKCKFEKQSLSSIAYIFLCGDVNWSEMVFSLRSKKIKCAVSEESKNYIQAMRRSRKINTTVPNDLICAESIEQLEDKNNQ